MGDRYTGKDAEAAVKRLAEALGLPYGHYVTTETEPPDGQYKQERPRADGSERWFTVQPNALAVDYNPTYGGCVIHQLADDGGTWIREPFSRERKSPREFVAYVQALIAGIEIGRKAG
jgi:hypothetical protein